MPRTRRIIGHGESFYHVTTRSVEDQLRFSDSESSHQMKLMRKVEIFSAVQVIAYCFMGDHFHLLLRVPPREKVSKKVLLERIEALYGPKGRKALEERWEAFEKNHHPENALEEQRRFIRRMYDLGEFMKTLKQRLSMSYNHQNERKGGLWEERYTSVLVEPTERVLAAVAAYIDLNPVRAELVDDPKDYPFSSYGAACAGDASARAGLCRIYRKENETPTWEKACAKYRLRLTLPEGSLQTCKNISGRELCAALENHGQWSLKQILGSKNQCFYRGRSVGRASFIHKMKRFISKFLMDAYQKPDYGDLELPGSDV